MENTGTKAQSDRDYFSTDHLKTDLKRRAVQGGGISVLSRMVSVCAQMAGAMVLARLLTPTDFGLVAMVASVTGFLRVFKEGGLTDATVQRSVINHRQISTLFWINVAFGTALALLLVGLSPLIAWFFDEPQLKRIAIVSSLSLVFAGLSTQHFALCKRNMLFPQIGLIQFGAASVGNLAAIALAMFGLGYWALVTRAVALSALTAVGAWIACQWRPGLPARRSGIRSMLTFGANTLGYWTADYFAKYLDKALIGWRYGARELGYYHKAFYLCSLPVGYLTTALQGVAVTTLTKLRDQPEKYRRYYINAISAISFVGMPVSAFVVVASHDLVLLLFGPQWHRTADIVSILGMAAGIEIVSSSVEWLHVSLGRADRWLRWGILGSSATAIAVVLGLRFGPLGVATAYTLSSCLLIGPSLAYAGKPINLRVRAIVSAIWRYPVAAACAALLSRYVLLLLAPASGVLIRLLIFFLVFTCAYLVLIVALFQDTKPITRILSLVREMFPRATLRPSRS